MATAERLPTPDSATSEPVVRRFLTALELQDFEALRSCFTDDLWFRALLPRRIVECSTGDEAAGVFIGWFAQAEALRWVELGHEEVTGRVRFCYRWEMRPDWSPEGWHVAEQVGYCRVEGDRIRRLDIVCTGIHPL